MYIQIAFKQKLVRETQVLKSASESRINMNCRTRHILMFSFLERGGGGGGGGADYVSSEIMDVKVRVFCNMLENADKIKTLRYKQILLHVQKFKGAHLYAYELPFLTRCNKWNICNNIGNHVLNTIKFKYWYMYVIICNFKIVCVQVCYINAAFQNSIKSKFPETSIINIHALCTFPVLLPF